MNIGKLDQRVTLQRKTLTGDGAGGATETWSEVAAFWAHVRPKTGREREQSMRAEATNDYVVVIRRRTVRPADRLLWRDRYLNVRAVNDAGSREQFLELDCELGAPT